MKTEVRSLPAALASLKEIAEFNDVRKLASTAGGLLGRLLAYEYPDPGPWTLHELGALRYFWAIGKIRLGIEVTNADLDTMDLSRIFGRLNWSHVDKVLVFSSRGFKSSVVDEVVHKEPTRVELLDFQRLESWVQGIESTAGESEVDRLQVVIHEFAGTLATMVAEDPRIIKELEWRDVERMLAVAFKGLGFQVELTPPAKDGGRDIELKCVVFGKHSRYFVEVKHWATPVHNGIIRDFLQVVISNQADSGLLLATSGYCSNTFESLTEIERRKVQLDDSHKMIAICRAYSRKNSGMLIPGAELPKLLFEKQ
ncbi:MAG: restriction endonuclease [Planctomycetaceae bacterium]|nr:restriction endonuclease [Planctomycetaceae bacterium]